MEIVQPIRERRKLEAMKTYLRGSNLRNYCIFVVGINTALRVSDLLALSVSDVFRNGKPADRIEIREQKTGKVKFFPLGRNAQEAIRLYIASRENYTLSSPLFPSQKGGGNLPLQRMQVWRALNDAAKAVGINDRIGTHTMRKTFGYWAFQENKDITLLQNVLNHDSPATTLRYIGITQDDIDRVYLSLNL